MGHHSTSRHRLPSGRYLIPMTAALGEQMEHKVTEDAFAVRDCYADCC